MSEKTNKTYLEKSIHRNRRGIALALSFAVLYGTFNANKVLGHSHSASGPEKTYIAKPADTEWGISQRAFPNQDPRIEEAKLDDQLPDDSAHANHTVQPGDKFVLPSDSAIGTPENSARQP